MIKIDTTSYCREVGHEPRGKAFWTFLLLTDRVTEKDHFHNPGIRTSYPAALKSALDLARRRRCRTVRVMP